MTIFLVMCGLFFVGGFFMLGFAVRDGIRARRAISWPTTQGELLTCEIEEHTATSDSDAPTTWQVNARYAYRVAGARFESKRIMFGYAGSTWKYAHEQLHQQLRDAPRLLVHYHPEEPATAVLMTGLTRHNYFKLVFSVVWLVFMAGMAFAAYKLNSPPCEADTVFRAIPVSATTPLQAMDCGTRNRSMSSSTASL